jgi:hypothetical protein
MGTAGEVAFLEADIAEHALDQGYVFGLATVRRARHRELLVTPAERVEPARAEKGQDLEGLGAGPPIRERISVASGAKELIAFPDYRGVYSMLRFNPFTAGNCDIELVRLDHTE